MADPIHPIPSAQLKFFRAKDHLDQLSMILASYVQSKPCSVELEMASDGFYAITIKAKTPLPISVPLLIGDAIHNMRACLDHLATGIAKEVGALNHVYFPFHETQKNLEISVINGPIMKARPKIAEMIINTIKPYRDGNFTLWSMNKMDAIDKHRLILTAMISSEVTGICGYDTKYHNSVENITAVLQGNGTFKVFDTDSPFFKITNPGCPRIDVIFDEELVRGKLVLNTLRNYLKAVGDAHNMIVDHLVVEPMPISSS